MIPSTKMTAEWTLTLRQVFQDVQLQAVEASGYVRHPSGVAYQRTLIPAVRRLHALFRDEVQDSKRNVIEEAFVLFLDELWLAIARVLVAHKVSDVVLSAVASLVGELLRRKSSKSKGMAGKDELRLELLKRLMDATQADDRTVRLRACHMLQLVVHRLEVIEHQLVAQLKATLLPRLKDKVTSIRIQSMYGLKPVLDSESDATLTRELKTLMVSDPSKDVRKAALMTLTGSSNLYDELLVRIRDASEDVRYAAFRAMGSAIALHDIPLSDRAHLLDQGLQDRAERVRRACEYMVLKTWFPACDSSPVLLLKAVDIEQFPAIGSKVARLLLAHFAAQPRGFQTTAVEFNALEMMSQTREAFTPESVFFWREQCHYYQKIDPDLEKAAALTPNVSDFSQLLVATCKAESDVLVIAQQLLELGQLLDFQDEVGRRNVLEALQTLLRELETESALIQGIMELMAVVYSSSEPEFIQVVAEIVSDMYDPVETDGSALQQEETVTVDDATNESTAMEFGPQLHKLSEEDREAAEVKFEALEKQLETLAFESDDYNKVQTEMVALEALLQDPRVLSWLRCLEIVAQLLKLTSHNLSDPVIEGMGRYILPAIDSDVPALREAGLENLGLYCLLDKRLAERYLIVFWRALNNPEEEKEVKHTCVQAILDLAFSFSNLQPHIFGTKQAEDEPTDESFKGDRSQENEASSQYNKERHDTSSKVEAEDALTSVEKLDLDTIFIGLGQLMTVDDVDLQSTIVEGFCRLFLLNRLDNITVLARLLETYFSPALQTVQRQRDHGFQSRSLQLLSLFFPAFVVATPANCMLMEEAATHLIQKAMEQVEVESEARLDLVACAKYVLHLLSHLAPDERGTKEGTKRPCAHHNRLGITICLELLALEKVAAVASIRHELVTTRQKTLLKMIAYVDVTRKEERSAALCTFLLHEVTTTCFKSQRGFLRSAEAIYKRTAGHADATCDTAQAQDQAWAHGLVREREEVLSIAMGKASHAYDKWLKKQDREKKRRTARELSSTSESESDSEERVTVRRRVAARRSKTAAVSRMLEKEGEFEAKIQRALDQDRRSSESDDASESADEESESDDESDGDDKSDA